MAGIHDHIKRKQKAIDRLDDLIARLILTSQESLRKAIMADIIPLLTASSGDLKNTFSNMSAVGRTLDVFTEWVEGPGLNLADEIARSVVKAHEANAAFYATTLAGAKTAKQISRAAESTLKSTIRRYGIQIQGRTARAKMGGYIVSTIADQAIARSIENVLRGAVISEGPLSKLRRDLGIELGRGSSAGVLERILGEKMPQPALKADREINVEVGQALQLNYAFYQGGEIQTTRPFCSERNNKVFSRDEIAKFGTPQDKYGGYTNKAAGEFQGKTKVYNPFLDLGGYNCRHSYDWISDELARNFRPELFKDDK